ncbi:UDP-glucuronosyl/UDP-glucosyltransferase [Parasponia andersonii]|uniref:Glycosyltransferase n=1 Tax=Parasponia andersonii TaxID=3476 RepID=A0A2P5CH02_PARAD|nr:UDP-glucuronosyl/UDP-glucosyltransferase [Parasponia andersonii]
MEKNINGDHNPKPHAVLIPYPLQGHVIPAVHLAVKLASRGFTITFVNTLSVHHNIIKSQPKRPNNDHDDDIFAKLRKEESGLDIRYATIGDGFPLGFDRSLNLTQFWEGIRHVFSAHVDELVGNMVNNSSDPVPLNCLIADTFFVWPSTIAKKYNLVSISFWTEPALVLTLYYHVKLLIKNGHHGSSHENRKDTINYIPGVKAIEPKDLMSYLQATDTATPEHQIIYKAFEEVKSADFIIINTVEELEYETISALKEKQPTYSIGPIFPTGFTKSLVATNLWSESDCTKWLDAKSHGTVLYVSFGSYAHASKRDIEEIAYGLLLSGVSFIWVLRPDIVSSDEPDFLPVGYEDQIKDKGLILTWCNQIGVISHPAIGGFVTHCGWNSILESVWCGLPLLTYPLLTDQFTNRKLVVDDWKIGINLVDDHQNITRDEIAEKINRLMSGKSSDELRKKVKEVRKTLENALDTAGSSVTNLNQFINGVKFQIQNKNIRRL